MCVAIWFHVHFTPTSLPLDYLEAKPKRHVSLVNTVIQFSVSLHILKKKYILACLSEKSVFLHNLYSVDTTNYKF